MKEHISTREFVILGMIILLFGCNSRYDRIDNAIVRFKSNNTDDWDIRADVNYYGIEGIDYLIKLYVESNDIRYLRILAYSNFKMECIESSIDYNIGRLEGSLNVIRNHKRK